MRQTPRSDSSSRNVVDSELSALASHMRHCRRSAGMFRLQSAFEAMQGMLLPRLVTSAAFAGLVAATALLTLA